MVDLALMEAFGREEEGTEGAGVTDPSQRIESQLEKRS